MAENIALQLGLHRELLPSPFYARGLDGHVLGQVKDQTSPVHMLFPGLMVKFSGIVSPEPAIQLCRLL